MMDKSLDDLKSTFNVLLALPNIEVDEVERDREGNYRVTIRYRARNALESSRDNFIDHLGHGKFIKLRHLPLSDGRSTASSPRRYQCQRCQGQPTTTQRATWYDAQSRCTKAIEHHILLACVNSTVWDVSIKEGISYEIVRGIIDRHIAKEVDWQAIKNLKIIGIDEISLKKGHQDFVTIVTGRMDGKTVDLGMLALSKKETVKEFFRRIPKRLRKNTVLFARICTSILSMPRRRFLGKRSGSSPIDFMLPSYTERAWMSYAKKNWHACGSPYRRSNIKS